MVVGLKPPPRIRVENFCHILVIQVNAVHMQCVLDELRYGMKTLNSMDILRVKSTR